MVTFTVSNANDSGDGSLRKAIASANASPGTDVIEVNSDVTLNSGLEITESLEIVGNSFTIDQTGSDRLFTIDDGNDDVDSTVSITGLTLTGGMPEDSGGAILSLENLEISHSILTDNFTQNRGGAVFVDGANLTIFRSRIADNAIDTSLMTSAGGGVFVRSGQLDVSNSEFVNNVAGIAGGLIVVDGTAEIENVLVAENQGGGIGIVDDSQLMLSSSTINDNADGGIIAINNNSLDISKIEVSNNTAEFAAGISISDNSDLEIDNSTIAGNQALINSGGIEINNGSTATIAEIAVIDNEAEEFGGGISIGNDSQVEIDNTTIARNLAIFGGGGIDLFSNSQLEISKSAITNNSAEIGGGIAIDDNGRAVVTNSSITENLALESGGAVDVFNNSQLEVVSSIIADNSELDGASITADETSTVDIINSVVEGAVGDIEGDISAITADETNPDFDIGDISDDLTEAEPSLEFVPELGDDTDEGSQDEDLLIDDESAEVLDGDLGFDIVEGSSDENTLFGNSSSELFIIDPQADTVTIEDFDVASDVIGLSEGTTYDELDISGSDAASISLGDRTIAVLSDVAAESLNSEQFIEL